MALQWCALQAGNVPKALAAGLRAADTPASWGWAPMPRGGSREDSFFLRRAIPCQIPHLPSHYYATLDLPYGTGLDRVFRTWRRLVKKSHPDLYLADEDKKRIATDLVQGLNRACEELGTHLERK